VGEFPGATHHGSGDINQVAGDQYLVPAPPPALAEPRQLPADVVHFTAREADLAMLDALLGEAAGAEAPILITAIDGMAGVGKTALAVHWSYRVLDRFPDGQLYLDLRGYSSGAAMPNGDAVDYLLRSLDVPGEKIPLALDERVVLYRSQIAGRRMLVVLDNAATPAQVRPLLPGSSTCAVLITSRSKLTGLGAATGVRRLTLGPLAPEEATRLLATIIGSQRITAEPAAVAAIAELCGHLPLALRIAAEKIASEPYAPLASAAQALREHRLDHLADDEDEETAVRTVLDWSYRALPPPVARLFGLLGLHPGREISMPAAGALADTGADQIMALLGRLLRVNLLTQIGPERYRMHDLVQEYACEHAGRTADREPALRRVLTWYLHTAAAAETHLSPQRRRVPLDPSGACGRPLTFGSYDEAMAWYEQERPNLTAAVRRAFGSGHYDLAWKLAASLSIMFYIRKYWQDWTSTHEIALVAAERLADPYAIAWISNNLGNAHYDLQQYQTAVRFHERALRMRRDIGDTHGAAISLLNLGVAYQGMGDLEAAITAHTEALPLFETAGDQYGVAMNLHDLGNAYRQADELDRALDHAQRALAVRRAIGDRHGEGFTLNNLGDIYAAQGRPAEAAEHLQEALRIRQLISDSHNEAVTLHSLGVVMRQAGRPDQATRYWTRAADILEGIDPDRSAVIRDLIDASKADDAGEGAGGRAQAV
jgi:tetratricopeptide (TPR) repeat protein